MKTAGKEQMMNRGKKQADKKESTIQMRLEGKSTEESKQTWSKLRYKRRYKSINEEKERAKKGGAGKDQMMRRGEIQAETKKGRSKCG